MEISGIILIMASLGAFFMAFNNGANDVANAFAAAVGSKALNVKQAIIIAGILNLVGALFLGSHVASTLIESVFKNNFVIDSNAYTVGMVAVLIASGCFVLLSTLTGLPVSSTNAIVGSLMGVGIVLGGINAVNWLIMTKIMLSWIISPFLSGFLAWVSIKVIKRFIYKKNKRNQLLKRITYYVPLFVVVTFALLIYSILHDDLGRIKQYIGYENKYVYLCAFLAILLVTYISIFLLIRKWTALALNSKEGGESIFKRLQVGSSCYVAFAHGANDVANSISPVLAIFIVVKTGNVPLSMENMAIPFWLLFLGGCGMSLGIAVLGYKVIATLGKKLTLVTNSKGFCVDFSTATTVVLASFLGIPISSTHAATGSVIGVGLEGGKRSINVGILRKILFAWFITVPFSAILTILMYTVLAKIFI